mgnify:CR=1 FL=1
MDTPYPGLVLAGDGLRVDWPIALMERAAVTGVLAANHLLHGWGVRGEDVWTVPLEGLLDPTMLERTSLHFGGRERHVFQYRYQPQRIWGVTASILFNLRERLARVAGEDT